ncbi:Uncharacterised protein [Mycobacteroides abscessus subsp. abscessus]|nr:Uncharacterised protein [Mycobacteroides abscessus subsp. abscessus]
MPRKDQTKTSGYTGLLFLIRNMMARAEATESMMIVQAASGRPKPFQPIYSR